MSISTRLKNAVWKAAVLIPLRWRLQFRVALLKLQFSRFEEEWHCLYLLGPNRGVALDIGANRGFYALRLAELYDNVIAFEPNEGITKELKARSHPRITIQCVALSSVSDSAPLFVPITKTGEVLDGWGSFDQGNFPDQLGRREVTVTRMTLDRLNPEGVSFIKLDVEGHELEVLRGALEFLKKQQPTILVEVRKENVAAIHDLLGSVGLLPQEIAVRIGRAGSDDMYLFAPER